MHYDTLRKKIKAQSIISSEDSRLSDMADNFAQQLGMKCMQADIDLSFQTSDVSIQRFDKLLYKNAKAVAFYSTANTIFTINADLMNFFVELVLGNNLHTVNEDKEHAYKPTAMDLDLIYPIISEVIDALKSTLINSGEKVNDDFCLIKNTYIRPESITLFDDDQDIVELTFNAGKLHNALTVLIPPNQVELSLEKNKKSNTLLSDQSAYWKLHMRNIISDMTVPLETIIEKFELKVSDISSLHEGDILPLDRKQLDEIQLVIRTPSELIPISSGKLGAIKKNKAIRIDAPPHPNVIEDITALLHGNKPLSV